MRSTTGYSELTLSVLCLILAQDHIFLQRFHCEITIAVFFLDEVNLAETASADYLDNVEVL
jgi:hypothetical protein